MYAGSDELFNKPPTDGIDYLPYSPGLYCWLNRKNGRRLVGQTQNMRKRGLQYRSEMKRGSVTNFLLRRDLAVYGYGAFFMFVLEHCGSDSSVQKMKNLEAWWTIQFQSHIESSGYNSEAGGVRTRHSRFRDQERKLMKAPRGSNYWLIDGVDIYDQIDPELLRTWVPGR